MEASWHALTFSSCRCRQVDQGRLTLPSRDYYINKTTANDHVLQAYLEYMTRVRTNAA